jgi:DNA polymerase V
MEIIEIFGYLTNSNLKMPFFTMSVSAGKPIPVESDIAKEIDLNEFLVEHPAATFFARVKGDSMKEYGIYDNDILIVDSSVNPEDGKLVIVSINGEFTIKIFRELNGKVFFESHNGSFLPAMNENYVELIALGTVTKIIHSL